jgi:hypothetical protein
MRCRARILRQFVFFGGWLGTRGAWGGTAWGGGGLESGWVKGTERGCSWV